MDFVTAARPAACFLVLSGLVLPTDIDVVLRTHIDVAGRTVVMLRSMTNVSCLYGLGDALAQGVEKYMAVESPGKKRYNYQRTGRMMVVGLVYAGPYMHLWYGGITRVASLVYPHQRWRSIFFKVGTDQLLGMAPFLTGYFALTGIVEGRSLPEVRDKVIANTHTAWGFGMLAWSPVQCINFAFVPPQSTVLFVASFSAVWTAYLSVLNHRVQYHDKPPATT